MQKSALLGDLNRNHSGSLASECEAVIEESDSVYVFPMCEDCFKKIKLIGAGFDRELAASMMITKVFLFPAVFRTFRKRVPQKQGLKLNSDVQLQTMSGMQFTCSSKSPFSQNF